LVDIPISARWEGLQLLLREATPPGGQTWILASYGRVFPAAVFDHASRGRRFPTMAQVESYDPENPDP